MTQSQTRAVAVASEDKTIATEAGNKAVDLDAVRTVYDLWAPAYDATFGRFAGYAMKKLVKSRQFAPGDRVLDIGIGTGLSLPLYSRDIKLVGVDAAPAMLERARQRKSRLGLDNVELHLRNAEHSGFEDGSFDCVMIMFVLSVTPDPHALLREALRVCRKGGDIYILNHFAGRKGLRLIERACAPFPRWIGFRSDMPIALLEKYETAIVNVEPCPPLGFFKLVHIHG
jgi:phosphatidylethanolamine/phosphatidyl-N-methylethanolamine N-methyltransferase